MQVQVDIVGQIVGCIGLGLMVLVCVMQGDLDDVLFKLVVCIVKLCIFCDEVDKMNCLVSDIGGVVLVVSQFMLVVDMCIGNCLGFFLVEVFVCGQVLYE